MSGPCQDPGSFDEIDPGAMRHHEELMTGHEGRPTVAEQGQTHGAGRPAVDNGVAEGPRKYGANI